MAKIKIIVLFNFISAIASFYLKCFFFFRLTANIGPYPAYPFGIDITHNIISIQFNIYKLFVLFYNKMVEKSIINFIILYHYITL